MLFRSGTNGNGTSNGNGINSNANGVVANNSMSGNTVRTGGESILAIVPAILTATLVAWFMLNRKQKKLD